MNKEYVVTHLMTGGSFGSVEFDDLLKMWEWVIELKRNPKVIRIWIDTTQEIFRREGLIIIDK